MSKAKLIKPFPWSEYSKKLISKIEQPRCAGIFTQQDASARQMRLVMGMEGQIEEGNQVCFYWLVDPSDGMVVDAKFQLFGQSALIGAAEAACELVIHKYYDQVKRIGADLIDKHLRDRSDLPAFPKETSAHLNLVIDAMERALVQCQDIPLPASYVSPVPEELGEGTIYPGWEELEIPQKLSVIEQVVKQEILPYIELDGGGVEVINLIEGKEVVISYQGNCTSCISSTGATLYSIQQILRSKVHPDLTVVPDFNSVPNQMPE